MKMHHIAMVASVLGFGLTVALVGMVGCDKPSTGDAESFFDENPFTSLPREEPGLPDLKVTPSGYSITNSSQVGLAILFSVTGGKVPITWEVVNEAAGTIEVQENGRDAVYRILALQPNTLIARDATGNAALASVSGQNTPALSIGSSDDPELFFDTETMLLYAIGGTGPYDWSLVYNHRGRFLRFGADQMWVEYARVQEPDQIVILTDANGAMAELRISQPDEAATDGGPTNAPATPLVATVTPATLAEDNDLALCVASGGVPPYTWTTINGGLGSILGSNVGPQAIYQRGAIGITGGDNAVIVTDSAGNTFYVIVFQPPIP